MNDYRKLDIVLRSRSYWSYKWNNLYPNKYDTIWMASIPELKNGTITPHEYCMDTIAKLSTNDANKFFPTCLNAVMNYWERSEDDRKILQTLVDTHNIVITSTLFHQCCWLDLKGFPWFVQQGYVPTMKQLLEPITSDNPHKRSNSSKNLLGKLIEYGVPYNHAFIDAFSKVLTTDSTITKKYIVSPEFMENFDFKTENGRSIYGMIIDAVFDKPVKLLTILKLLNRNISYQCLQRLVGISNFSADEMWSMIEHIYAEPYIIGNEIAITRNLKLVSEHLSELTEIVNWLCSGNQGRVIETLHKNLKFKFTQYHIDKLVECPKCNYTIIKYILEKSSRKDIIVTRNIVDKVLETGRVPRHVSMIVKYIKLPGDVDE